MTTRDNYWNWFCAISNLKNYLWYDVRFLGFGEEGRRTEDGVVNIV
jgi:hypothetical protein